MLNPFSQPEADYLIRSVPSPESLDLALLGCREEYGRYGWEIVAVFNLEQQSTCGSGLTCSFSVLMLIMRRKKNRRVGEVWDH